MSRYQYVIDDGGTVEDALLAALRDVVVFLGNPLDCPAERWKAAREAAQEALKLRVEG